MNEFINKAPEVKEEKQAATPGKIASVTDFSFYLTREKLNKMLPFIFFLFGIALFYIANAHYAMKTVRDTDKASREIKELRSEYITIKSDLMFRSKQSEVAKRLEATGLKALRNPPKKITIDPDEY